MATVPHPRPVGAAPATTALDIVIVGCGMGLRSRIARIIKPRAAKMRAYAAYIFARQPNRLYVDFIAYHDPGTNKDRLAVNAATFPAPTIRPPRASELKAWIEFRRVRVRITAPTDKYKDAIRSRNRSDEDLGTSTIANQLGLPI